ncbi:TetR/AcrR family transcriptional regulator [Tsukamurella sp. 1534]|uniref:TetR/AcrR family transcriptional regulator n=1 Tax=Tsukamurella sp. 1534 TaxID=1151061 RepID=UPI0003166217|nr:TetR family transcriptional regulator [Tsukamurella sp. 1534]
MTETTRRRDPERRRREIVDAAVALMVESGSGSLTHRKVAARAGVPLGSTTQYFATLDDLRGAALRSLMEEAERWLAELENEFVRSGATPAAFASALHRYISDPDLVHGDFAMTCAAATSDDMVALQQHWTAVFVGTLTRYVPLENAQALAMYADGAAISAAIGGEPIGRDRIERAVTALWNL